MSLLGQRLVEGRPSRVQEKPGAGLVTELDLELERQLRPYLTELVPGSTVVGEEEGGATSEWTWWIDPLDGTTNFVHGWPRSAISLALYRGQEPHLGLVHDPYLKETFWSQKGEGSWCGEHRLRVSQCTELKNAMLATGFAPEPPSQWEICRKLQAAGHGLRVSGCAALDLAYVACGRLDAFWEVDLKPWDVAAGLLLVREAGGVVSDLQGGSAGLGSANYLAAGPGLQPQLLEFLAEL
ncbi:inositol monophosphatase [bacterium]|nr:inositol monophosphatase [bacterium]